MDYNNLSKSQVNELYTYYTKTLINKKHEYQNATFHNKSKIRMEVQQVCIAFNKLRKTQGDLPITVLQIHIGDQSFYLEFF